MVYYFIKEANITQDMLDACGVDNIGSLELIDGYKVIHAKENGYIAFKDYVPYSKENLERARELGSVYLDLKVRDRSLDTGGYQYTPRFSPKGFHEQLFETEFKTSTYDSIHEKDANNQDIGWSYLKFYKDDGQGNEIECVDAADALANAIRTDLLWMPNCDYMIKGGWLGQITSPASDVYFWAQGIVLDEAFGGAKSVFVQGGSNMAYVGPQKQLGLNGVSGTMLYYDKIYDSANDVFIELPPGVGTNRLNFMLRHPQGFTHRFQVIVDIFIK